MRIIAGKFKGRAFSELHKHRMHPMGTKIRGALFNVLGDVEGLEVLDAFAGSGAISFEAISRGAKSVIAIEKDKIASKNLEKNVKKMSLSDEIKVIGASANGWSANNINSKFDIVVLDPPFSNLQIPLLRNLVDRHVKNGGLIVLSFPGSAEAVEFKGANIVAQKNYGDARLEFYRKTLI